MLLLPGEITRHDYWISFITNLLSSKYEKGLKQMYREFCVEISNQEREKERKEIRHELFLKFVC